MGLALEGLVISAVLLRLLEVAVEVAIIPAWFYRLTPDPNPACPVAEAKDH